LIKTIKEEKKIKKQTVQQIKLERVKVNFLLKNNKKKNNDNGFNFTFQKSKIYGIYGASGSGKTSILNLLSGFIKSSSGSILFNGKVYRANDITKKFNIGYAPQLPTIIDDDVITNVTLKYNNSREIISKLKFFLLKFNLKKFTRTKYYNSNEYLSIKNMSGGERQRIGFIRSVIHNPSLILLDEPTSSLDKENEQKIFTFLKSIKKDRIIIITSHNLNHIKYFDKIINL
jgi:ABC-type transport system involved in cytochrome bd biosynthesis fused ATPase/permease subunit